MQQETLPSGRPKRSLWEGSLPRENLIPLQLNQPFFPFEGIVGLQPLTEERLWHPEQDSKKAAEVNISLQGSMGFISLWHVLPYDSDERAHRVGTVITPLGPVRYTEVREGLETRWEQTPLRLAINFIATPPQCARLEQIIAEITLGDNSYRAQDQGSLDSDFYLRWFLDAPIHYTFIPIPDNKGKMYQPDIWLPSDLTLLRTVGMRFVERKAIETATA